LKAIKIHESARNYFFTSLLADFSSNFSISVSVRKKLPLDLCVVSKQDKPPGYSHYWKRHCWFLKDFVASVIHV